MVEIKEWVNNFCIKYISDINIKNKIMKLLLLHKLLQELIDLALKGKATELEAQLTKDNISTKDEVSSFRI